MNPEPAVIPAAIGDGCREMGATVAYRIHTLNTLNRKPYIYGFRWKGVRGKPFAVSLQASEPPSASHRLPSGRLLRLNSPPGPLAVASMCRSHFRKSTLMLPSPSVAMLVVAVGLPGLADSLPGERRFSEQSRPVVLAYVHREIKEGIHG